MTPKATPEPTPEPIAELGEEAASYQARVLMRRAAGTGKATPPTIGQLEGAIEAALLGRFPDFSPSVRAERLDRD